MLKIDADRNERGMKKPMNNLEEAFQG